MELVVVTGGGVLPDRISEFLGVAPQKTWMQGDLVSPGRAITAFKQNGWSIGLDGDEGELYAYVIVDRLIALIPQGRLAALSERYQGSVDVQLAVIAWISEDFRPSIALTPSQISFLAACNGSFDVDLYLDVDEDSDS